MANSTADGVRPTKRCLDDLGLPFPDLTQSLVLLTHPLVRRAQSIPEEVDAGGAERVRSLSDRIWFKCKVSDQRGIATRLTPAEAEARSLPSEAAWWIGAAGVRQSERLEAEAAALVDDALRGLVITLIAKSMKDSRAYVVELGGARVTAMVKAADNVAEAYLVISAEGFVDYRLIALILGAVPGIEKTDWQPEPGGVVGITVGPGEIIWSTIISTEVQADILARADRSIP